MPTSLMKKPSKIDLQIVCSNQNIPSKKQFKLWVNSVLNHQNQSGDICIRLVDKLEIQNLNHTFRKKNYPTNILSFYYNEPSNTAEDNHLGDLVICPDVVTKEAFDQNKKADDHWAHLTIHGVLHLLGFVHETDEEALEMESIETDILSTLGIQNPYT